MLALTCKAEHGLAPSYIAELVNDFVLVRVLRSFDTPTWAVPLFFLIEHCWRQYFQISVT